MTVDDVLRDIKGKVRGVIPPSIDVSDVEFEGALVVIYTKHPDKFAKNEELVKQLAKMLQKRIAVRPDPSVITDSETAEKKIKNIIPIKAHNVCKRDILVGYHFPPNRNAIKDETIPMPP